MAKIPESAIEKQILQWLAVQGIYAFKNYDQASFRDGSYRKTPFQKRGLSDIIALLHKRTIFIEVKSVFGKQSEFQKKFEQDVKKLGHEYYVVRCLDDAKKIIWNK